MNFVFLQFQLLRQTSFIWYFDLPYFFSWLNYYIDVYIVSPSQWCTFRATNPAGQVSRFGSGCVLLLRVIMWLLLRHDSAWKTYGSCFFLGMIYVDISWYMKIYIYIRIYIYTYILVHDDFSCSLQLLKVRWPKLFFQLMVPCGSQILQLWASPPSLSEATMQRACEMVSQRMVGEISSMWIPNDILPEMDENGEFGVKIERKDSMDFYGLD